MSQTRRMSAVEAVANVAIGYGIAVLAQIAISAFGVHLPLSDRLLIGAAFTVVSLVRSYAVRRCLDAIREG